MTMSSATSTDSVAAIVATDEPGTAARTRPTLTASPPRAGATAFSATPAA